MSTSDSAYLLAGQMSELERLQLQSRVWEPAGRALLDRLGSGQGLRVVDVGCGCFGWLRLLSQWVGPKGSVTGTDVDAKLLDAARTLIDGEGLANVGSRTCWWQITRTGPGSSRCPRWDSRSFGRPCCTTTTYSASSDNGSATRMHSPSPRGSRRPEPSAHAGPLGGDSRRFLLRGQHQLVRLRQDALHDPDHPGH
jgi:hypothetical protein